MSCFICGKKGNFELCGNCKLAFSHVVEAIVREISQQRSEMPHSQFRRIALWI